MPEQTTSSIVIDATPAQVMAVIVDFEAYPAWAQGMKAAEVLSSDSAGRAEKVHFELEAAPIKDSYTLAYRWDEPSDTGGGRVAQVTWSLVEGTLLRALDGAYVLRALGGGRTEVTYRLVLDLSIPLIGMLKRKGEKILIDTALRGLKERVESL